MGWSIGYDDHHDRDIGYGVPAECDHPSCAARIDRGMAYRCDHEEGGCGLFFCGEHRNYIGHCERCQTGTPSFTPKPDLPEWVHHKLTDPSWQEWRDAYPAEVAALRGANAQ